MRNRLAICSYLGANFLNCQFCMCRLGPTSLNAVVPAEFTADAVVVITDRGTPGWTSWTCGSTGP